MAEIKAIRRKISARLWKAKREGRLTAELRAMDRRADEWLKNGDQRNGNGAPRVHRNGRKAKAKK